MRRYLMMFTLLVQALAFVSSASPPPTARTCKAIPGSANWPSISEWNALNQSISGQLIHPDPPGGVCHPGQPNYSSAGCAAVQAGWLTTAFHAADPVSTDENNWNNDTCLPYPQFPCSGQGYPVYVVNATCADYVKKGVDFARKHNVRLIVKGTGHDYQGRSVAPNSLSIWTHHMKGLTFHDSFKLTGCKTVINTKAVTARAGSQWGELNQQANLRNLTLVSGGASTVGIGGYLTGGGHGALSATYGLAADQVLEMEIVTPRGAILTINECQHSDLFWAMRGGGGSTFGVLLSATMRAFPSTPFATLVFAVVTSPFNRANFLTVAASILSKFPSLAEQGIAGYPYFTTGYAAPGLGNGSYAAVAGSFNIPIRSPQNSTSSLSAPFQAIIDNITATFPGQFYTALNATLYDSFYDWWVVNDGPLQAGEDNSLGSRLLPPEVLTQDPVKLKTALNTFPPGFALPIYLVSGKGVWNAAPRGGGNAVNPAWRKALIHTPASVSWAPFNETMKREQQNLMTNTYIEALRVLAPNSGAYVNEADHNEPNFQQSFWGTNYPRLLQIKRRVDPHDTLWCNPCVGNERWEEVGDSLCRK